jgi:hypothetical protein
MLRNRIGVHALVATVEWIAIAGALVLQEILVHTASQLSMLIKWFLTITLCAVSGKSFWIICVAWGYYRIKGTDLKTAVRRMGMLQSTTCWSCAEIWVTCGTVFSMVWYASMFMLITLNSGESSQGVLVWSISLLFFGFALLNYFLWRDATLFWEEDLEPQDERMAWLCHAYKSKFIDIGEHSKHAVEDSNISTTCVVCLEEFAGEESVAKLPCGHVFHPLCSHIWIREHWNCPLRCSLGTPWESEKQAQAANGVPQTVAPQPHSSDRQRQEVMHDLEGGRVARSTSSQEVTHSMVQEVRHLIRRSAVSTDAHAAGRAEVGQANLNSEEPVLASDAALDIETGVSLESTLPNQVIPLQETVMHETIDEVASEVVWEEAAAGRIGDAA